MHIILQFSYCTENMKCINLKSIIQKFSDFYLKKQEKVELEYLKIMIFPRKESELETAFMTFNALHFKRQRLHCRVSSEKEKLFRENFAFFANIFFSRPFRFVFAFRLLAKNAKISL